MSCDSICKGGEFTCRDRKTCISSSRYCDGSPDCPDGGSDEFHECVCHKAGKFACASRDQCVDRLKVCDGTRDCSDGSDEDRDICPKNATKIKTGDCL